MSKNLVTIEISDETTLLKACDILHDARFELGKAVSDKLAGTWSAIFIRENFEDASLTAERLGIIFTKLTFPMAESILEPWGISECDVRDRSRICKYTFNECQVSRGKYRFLFNENMEIVLTFQAKPNGRLRDTRLLDERGSYYALRNPFRRRRARRWQAETK